VEKKKPAKYYKYVITGKVAVKKAKKEENKKNFGLEGKPATEAEEKTQS
jgi:hypothetical protein